MFICQSNRNLQSLLLQRIQSIEIVVPLCQAFDRQIGPLDDLLLTLLVRHPDTLDRITRNPSLLLGIAHPSKRNRIDYSSYSVQRRSIVSTHLVIEAGDRV